MTPRQQLQAYFEAAQVRSSRSFHWFLRNTVINSHPDPKRFEVAADPWQFEIANPKIEALQGLCGISEYNGPRSFLTVLGRGHDKSSLEARLIACALCFSQRKIEGYLCAADFDQAALILRALKDEAELNPWWGKLLTIQRDKVIGPQGIVEVVPADAGSAYGFRGNLYVMDEVTHWKNDKLWTAVVSGRQKVPGSLLICITNAGVLGSWQHKQLWQTAIDNPGDWKLFYRRGHLASWVTEKSLLETRRLISEREARRVIDNEWVDAAEDSGYLSVEEVDACVQNFHRSPPPGAKVICAIDYGAVRDRSAMAHCYLDSEGVVRVSKLSVAQGAKGRPVPITLIEQWVRESAGCHRIIVDPHQLESVCQKFPWIERITFRGGAFNCEIASNLRSLVTSGRIRWNPGEGAGFTEELKGLVTYPTQHGFRFDHKSGKHDDQAFSVAVAALEALKYPTRVSVDIRTEAKLYQAAPEVFNPMTLFGG